MAKIFISYRREDSAPWAGRLYERLARDFRRDELFIDVDNIAPGLDFVKVLDEQVAACDVALVIIGKNWLNAVDELGARRLDDPKDFVRIEIESALKRDIHVIPMLVDGAKMPRSEELPESLRRLTRQNATSLSHEKFGPDTAYLLNIIGTFSRSRFSESEGFTGFFGWVLRTAGTSGALILGIISGLLPLLLSSLGHDDKTLLWNFVPLLIWGFLVLRYLSRLHYVPFLNFIFPAICISAIGATAGCILAFTDWFDDKSTYAVGIILAEAIATFPVYAFIRYAGAGSGERA